MTESVRKQLDQILEEFRLCQKALTAIGDETRQHIICVMLKECRDHGMRVTDITQYTNLSRPAVSHHIQILKDAGIVKSRKEGTMVYYYLDPDAQTVSTIASLMGHVAEMSQSSCQQ